MKGKSKGITLIALVITIIVLLILAGVGIATLTGENGIITKAVTAVTQTTKAEEKELIKIAYISLLSNGLYKEEVTAYDLQNELNQSGINAEILQNEKEKMIIMMTNNENIYELNMETGKISDISYETLETMSLTAENIANSALACYGKSVTNYACPNSEACGWQIFHSDGNNIYLIADNYIASKYVPSKDKYSIRTVATSEYYAGMADVIKAYEGTSNITTDNPARKWLKILDSLSGNITERHGKMLAYMLDYQIWSEFKGVNADYAVAGPTLDLLVASYNKVHKDQTINYKIGTHNGYVMKFNSDNEYGNRINLGNESEFNNLYIISNRERTWGMYIPYPADVYNCVGRTAADGLICWGDEMVKDDFGLGFRPIVCLNANVKLIRQLDGTFEIQ